MKNYTLSLTAKTLTITKAFEEAIAKGEGAEYETYKRLMKDIPGLKVIRKTHKTPISYTSKSGEKFKCNQFKNLTYQNMEHFMSALPNKEEYLQEYTFLKDCASAVQHSGYALVRKWFVVQFPEFRKNPLFYLSNSPKVISAIPFMEKATAEAETVA